MSSMIKANELRIGNLIADYECAPYYFEVEEIKKYINDEIWVIYRQGSFKAKEVTPIPLTEEWFVRLGFENKYGFLSLGLLSCIWGEEEACYYVYYGEDKNNEIKIRYVHQLQNLYFALTGEELTLNQ